MMRVLLRIWAKFPLWVHMFAAWLLLPRFRVAVAALIFDERRRVLLFKHTYRKFALGIPAGALEHGEQPDRAIVREILEET